MIIRSFFAAAFTAVFVILPATTATAGTLNDVKARGSLNCGVNQDLQGFSKQIDGKWQGFDVDFCRAVATAVLGDDTKVNYIPLSVDERFEALRDGKIDLLSRNSTWTLEREAQFGLNFIGVSYYDGQGFMVPRTANKESALDLDGSSICVLDGTTNKENIPDYFTANNMAYTLTAVARAEDAIEAFEKKLCGVVTSDVSQLYAWRLRLKEPDEYVILPDTISKEPLGPAVRQDDPKWTTIIKWVLFALINAEELGITAERVDEALASKKPRVKQFTAKREDIASRMGLAPDWTVNVIRATGNYGEIFSRHLGTDSELGIDRGLNQLWDRGGILYAPPY